jgi:hypothetical protein
MTRLVLRPLLLACIAVPLGGCYFPATPVSTAATNNPDVDVEELVTHDGCTVYRFRDRIYHYYVRCRDGAPGAPGPTRATSTSSPVSCGKTCVRSEEIETVMR